MHLNKIIAINWFKAFNQHNLNNLLSLYSDDAVPPVELSLRRSSLADLLYAANFNSCESNQASIRIMTALT